MQVRRQRMRARPVNDFSKLLSLSARPARINGVSQQGREENGARCGAMYGRSGTWSGIAHRVPVIPLQAGLRARVWNFFLESAPSRAREHSGMSLFLQTRLPLRGQRRHTPASRLIRSDLDPSGHLKRRRLY